jgi:hypothetical protein
MQNIQKIFVGIATLLFFALFVYAAASKLNDFEKFRSQLGQSPLLTSFARFVAWAIPTIELVISGMLCFNKSRLNGLYASFALMTLFTLYILVITQYSVYVPCSCGGLLQSMSWNQHLLFNIIFVCIAIIGVLIHSQKPGPSDSNLSIAIKTGEAENL